MVKKGIPSTDQSSTLKRKILALAIGGGFIFFVASPLQAIIFASTQNMSDSGIVLTISLLIAATITGYIARQKGWLYGALLILLSYILTALVIVIPIIYNVLEAQTRNIPVSGDTALIPQFILNTVLIIVLPAVLIGAMGGYVGEALYRKWGKSRHK